MKLTDNIIREHLEALEHWRVVHGPFKGYDGETPTSAERICAELLEARSLLRQTRGTEFEYWAINEHLEKWDGGERPETHGKGG